MQGFRKLKPLRFLEDASSSVKIWRHSAEQQVRFNKEAAGPIKRVRMPKEDRFARIKAFVESYKEAHGGTFPSVNLVQAKVGGSFYMVRGAVQELMNPSTQGIIESTEEKSGEGEILHGFEEGNNARGNPVLTECNPTREEDKTGREGTSVLDSQGATLTKQNLLERCIDKLLNEKDGKLNRLLRKPSTQDSSSSSVVLEHISNSDEDGEYDFITTPTTTTTTTPATTTTPTTITTTTMNSTVASVHEPLERTSNNNNSQGSLAISGALRSNESSDEDDDSEFAAPEYSGSSLNGDEVGRSLMPLGGPQPMKTKLQKPSETNLPRRLDGVKSWGFNNRQSPSTEWKSEGINTNVSPSRKYMDNVPLEDVRRPSLLGIGSKSTAGYSVYISDVHRSCHVHEVKEAVLKFGEVVSIDEKHKLGMPTSSYVVTFKTQSAQMNLLSNRFVLIRDASFRVTHMRPKTTVVRLSNLPPDVAHNDIASLCKRFGKVNSIEFRGKGICDVFYSSGFIFYMPSILDRLNSSIMKDRKVQAYPAPRFNPENARSFNSPHDFQLVIRQQIANLLQQLQMDVKELRMHMEDFHIQLTL